MSDKAVHGIKGQESESGAGQPVSIDNKVEGRMKNKIEEGK